MVDYKIYTQAEVDTELGGKVGKGDLVLNVKDAPYNAVGNGIVDDTTAIQNAINDAGSNKIVYFPSGTYLVSGATGLLLTTTGARLHGASRESVKIQSVTGDVITISNTAMVTGIELEGLSVFSNPGGGHCINVPYGLAQSKMTFVKLQQFNNAKSILYCHPAGAGGLFDNDWDNFYFYMPTTSTVPGFDVVGTGNACSANKWTRGRVQGGGTYIFHLEAGAGNYCYNNTLDTINFEQCDNGGIRVYSGMNTAINQIGFFDNSTVNVDLILMSRADTGKPQSRGTAIRSVHRSNGSLGASAVDIRLASGQNVGSNLIEAVSSPTGAPMTIDVGASSGYALLMGIDSNVTVLNAQATRTTRVDATTGVVTPALQLGTVQVRDSSGTLQTSTNGINWSPIDGYSLSVTKFGALGDGVTNDAAAINAAINAAAAATTFGPVTVTFPYTSTGYASGSIVLKSGVTLKGINRVLLKATGTNVIWINATAVSRVGLEGFTLDAAGNPTSAVVRVSTGTDRFTIRDNKFTTSVALAAGVDAILVQGGTTNALIERNEFSGMVENNVHISNDAQSTTVQDNVFTGWGTRAIYVVGSATLATTDLWIKNNKISNVSTAGTVTIRQPIAIQGATGARHSKTKVEDNTITGNGLAHHQGNDGGTLLGGTSDQISLQHCEDFIVSGNHSLDGGEVGITVSVDCHNGTVNGNTVKGCNTAAVALGGASSDVYDVTVSGNAFRNNGKELSPPATGDRTGIHAAVWCSSAHGVVIEGNTVADDNTGTQRYVVYMVNSDHVQVGTNNIHGLVSELDPASAGYTNYTTSVDSSELNAWVASLANLPAGSTITVESTTSWPVRPTARTDIYVIWLDVGGLGTEPPGALNIDQWEALQ